MKPRTRILMSPGLTWGPQQHLRWLDAMVGDMRRDYRAAEEAFYAAIEARTSAEAMASADIARQVLRGKYLAALERAYDEARTALGLEDK